MKTTHRHKIIPFVAFTVILTSTLSFAGSYQRTDFSDTNGTFLTNSNGLGLDIQRYGTVKVWGDSLAGAMSKSYTSDVISGISDTFTVFWVDSAGKHIKKSRSILFPNSSQIVNSSSDVITDSIPYDCFLHASNGNSGYLLSFSHKIGSRNVLTLLNQTTSMGLDTCGSSNWLFPSQCSMENDTFLIAYGINMTEINLCKVYSRGSTLKAVSSVTVDAGTGKQDNCILNCSVGYDGNGNILVLWSKGSPTDAKTLYYKFYDRDLVAGHGGSFVQTIGTNSLRYYDDSRTTSYAPGKFCVVFWDESGILKYDLTISAGGAVQVSGSRIVNNAAVRYCAAAANRKSVVVVYKGDVDNDGLNEIRGIRYPIVAGSLGPGEPFTFASGVDPQNTIGDMYTSINCAIDTTGSIAVTWANPSTKAKLSVWAYRGVRYTDGYWTSQAEQLPVPSGDSVRFYPAQVTCSDLSSWNITDSVRFGCTVPQCISAPFVSLSDNSALNVNRSGCPYFQYRIHLQRKSGKDSLKTPTISSINIHWNTQPEVLLVDSLKTLTRTYTSLNKNSLVTVLSRIDTLHALISLRDADSGQLLSCALSWPHINQAQTSSSGAEDHIRFNIPPVDRSDTIYTCGFSVLDTGGWYSDPFSIRIATRNSPPVIGAGAIIHSSDGKFDTIPVPSPTRFEIQQDDSIEFYYSVSDTNDPSIKTYLYFARNGISTKIDSAASSPRFSRFAGSEPQPCDSIRVSFTARDPDTLVSLVNGLRINHFPRIVSFSIDGITARDGDTIRVNIGKPTAATVVVSDTDLAFWDTAFVQYSTRDTSVSFKSVSSTINFNFKPSRTDSLMTILIKDRYGKKDSVHYYMKYPWLDKDSVSNPGYSDVRKALNTSPSLIDGSKIGDTLVLTYLNTGNDTMSIEGLTLSSGSKDWLSIGVPQDTGIRVISYGNSSMKSSSLLPDSSIAFSFYFTAAELSGDTVVHDTVIVRTSDPFHEYDTIPVRLEYNDLPNVVDVNPSFEADIPYVSPYLGKRKKTAVYRFPPHASIEISFSEPMDSVSALKGVVLYSVFDSLATGKLIPIPTSFKWSGNYTNLFLSPEYNTVSPRFGIKPVDGLFIPTDSLGLKLTTDLVDRATTPSGPNRLDVNMDLVRDFNADTTVHMRVDSITFTLVSITPSPGDNQTPLKPMITLEFSSPVYGTSVDKSFSNNKSLIVRSKYNEGAQLPFDSIAVNGNKVSFRIGRMLSYEDSVWCRFRGITIRDLMGFPSDNNLNGIPSQLFDTSSIDDDVAWMYKIKTVRLTSIQPDSGSSIKTVTPRIVIRFSDSVHPGMFDPDTSTANRSFRISSLYSGGLISPGKIEFSTDSTEITLSPRVFLFSNDTVHCNFTGFSSNFRYSSQVNYPDSINVFAARKWSFSSGYTGFYTYPNPYKPGIDPRHCRINGPCGIWFKNLHALKSGLLSVGIRIFDMNAVPVYDSWKAGENISFSIGDPNHKPQWLWNTRNQHGDPVASGIYFYAIYDPRGKLLVKDKLVIIR